MLDKLKAFAARIRVRADALLVLLLAVLPDILNELGVIDLKPILGPLLGDDRATMATTYIAVFLAVMKPMIHLAPKEDSE